MYILDGCTIIVQGVMLYVVAYEIRLGHVSEKGLIELTKQNLLNVDDIKKLGCLWKRLRGSALG